MGKDILERLSAKNPKYSLIFRELLKVVMKPSDIAHRTGLKANQTCEDIRKVRALVEQYFQEMKR